MDVQICGEHSGAAEEKPLYRRSAIGDRTLMAAVGGGFFSFYSPSSLSLLFFFVFSLSLSRFRVCYRVLSIAKWSGRPCLPSPS